MTDPSRPPPQPTPLDPAAPLLFIVNGTAGRGDDAARREAIAGALAQGGRRGELLCAPPDKLPRIAREAAAAARAARSAVVAVGGDGTLNAVAQAAHAAGCAMGVVPQGTFNYFARAHGIPADAGEATRALLQYTARPVQVGQVNDQVFLVNASVGLYPRLLQDREALKARWGRSRLVALGSALVTLLRGPHRRLRLRIASDAGARDVRTQMLFVGNNRLQLEQVGLPAASAIDAGCIAAVMLRPVDALALAGLLLRGAFGGLGQADTVESFAFRRLDVALRFPLARRPLAVALDGEIRWMRPPLAFRVAAAPLQLLAPPAGDDAGH